MQVGPLILALCVVVPASHVVCERGTWHLRTQLQRLLQHITPMPASCTSCLWSWPWMQVWVQWKQSCDGLSSQSTGLDGAAGGLQMQLCQRPRGQ